MPYKHMPALEIDGKKYCQSHAIGRFLGRELGLAGKTSLELLKADEFAESCIDALSTLPWTESDQDKIVSKKIKYTAVQ